MDAWLSKVCLFTTLMLLELQGSRRAVDISWLISKVGWLLAPCFLKRVQFMWWLHSKPESIWSCLIRGCLSTWVVRYHASWFFSLALDGMWLGTSKTEAYGVLVKQWTPPVLFIFLGGGRCFFKMTKNDKWQIKCMMTSSLWLQPNRVIITAVVAKILIWILYKHDLIDLKLFWKLYM